MNLMFLNTTAVTVVHYTSTRTHTYTEKRLYFSFRVIYNNLYSALGSKCNYYNSTYNNSEMSFIGQIIKNVILA